MPLDFSDLTGMDETAVTARLLRLTELVEGLGAGASVRRGFIRDFVLRLNAILGQASSDRLDVIGYSLNPLITASSNIDSNILSATALTYGLSRRTESFATGSLIIEVSSDRSVLIPSGTVFVTNDGRKYATSQAFAARTLAAEIQTFSDRELIQNLSGNYEFRVEATALSPGLIGNIPAGTTLSFESITIGDLVNIKAAADFSGGRLNETDAQLIARIRRQLPAKTLSTRASIAATLAQVNVLPDLLAISTIGYGDIEMRRNIRQGMDGRGSDVYIRTQALPKIESFLLTAKVVELTTSGKAVWQIDVNRDTAPGFYRVLSVSAAQIGELTDITITRGFDNSPIAGELSPKLTTALDAGFSRYQTAVITGRSQASSFVLDQEINVSVVFSYMPGIVTAQQTVNSRVNRFVGGDTLVRAAIPTFVSVGIDIHARFVVEFPDPQIIKDAVADELNNAGFAGRLHASRLASLVHEYLPVGADVGAIEFILETLAPDGTISRVRTRDHIDVPSNNELAISPRTAVFICDPAAVAVHAYAETLPDVV